MSDEFSLPPLIKDDAQGRLNMIITRPNLIPSLHPEQVLEFRYCWWGSEYTHKIRLYPGCDDIRIVYDIRCDIKGLQRYFIDAEYLIIELSVSGTESDVQHSTREHQIRKKKEWKAGDFIGKFSLSGLKLNARGEYINDCNIYNNYGDHLGSVVICILYTTGDNLVSAPKAEERRKESQRTKNTAKKKETIIHPQSNQITPKKHKVLSRENHSPRFIPLGKCNAIIKGKFSPQKSSESSPKLIENVKFNQTNDHEVIAKNNNEEANSNILSSLYFPNKKHILTRLFSFVDSGALHQSDLPALIQICQGRSPSIDLDSFERLDDQIQNLDNYQENTNEKVIFNDKFLQSLSLNADHDSGKLPAVDSSTFEPSDLKINKLDDKFVSSEPSDEELSLLVLLFHSVQLTDQLKKKDVNQQKKKIVVRQRSKICYFVEIVLEFEDTENLQSTTLVSRQITEKQEIVFNCRKIFQLQNGKRNGYLKFRVSRRQMGNQKPDPVGVGIVSLNQIKSEGGNEKCVAIPLWTSNEISNDIKTNNQNVEKPAGYLIFNVAFAMSCVSSHEENSLQTPAEGGNDFSIDAQIDKNISTLQSGYTVLEKKIDPPEKHLDFFENVNNQESLIIETSENVKYIPTKNTDAKSLKEVHLEILEANGLPLLRSKRTNTSFQPNSYVLTTIPPNFTFKTKIIKSSSSPVWNARTNFSFHREDLEHTNYKLILKLFHSFDGESTQLDDPLLGFAPIDINFLWNSFLSLCGWIPLLDLDGSVCGEIKVSVTPRKPVCNYMEKPDSSDNRILNDSRKPFKFEDSFTTIDKDTECKELSENSKIYPGEFLPHCTRPPTNTNRVIVKNKLTKSQSLTSENISDSRFEKPTKYSRHKTSSFTFEVDEEVQVEEPIVDFADVTPSRTGERSSRAIIEAMQWMNHMDPLDSPCVSYLDIHSNATRKETFDKPVKVTSIKPNCKKKCRIAANLNFLHDG